MPKTFFITTAIDYTNSPPHIGHAYEKVLADVIARYHRLKGEKVFFLTKIGNDCVLAIVDVPNEPLFVLT